MSDQYVACRECGLQKPRTHAFFGKAGGWTKCRDCVAAYKRKKQAEMNYAGGEDKRPPEARRVYSDTEKLRLWEMRGGVCLCCLKPIPRQELSGCSVDHIEPVIHGGSSEDDNLAVVHQRCNTDKHKKTLAQHWQWRFDKDLDAVRITRTDMERAVHDGIERATMPFAIP